MGRVVHLSEVDGVDFALVCYNEQQNLDTLKYGQDPNGQIPHSLTKLADTSQSKRFLRNFIIKF